MIDLGQMVKDKVTGATGFTIARTEYLYDTPLVLVQPVEIKDGASADSKWVSEARLFVTDEKGSPATP